MQFREFEISNFRGIASSNRHPQKNECQECKNFDTRYIDGDLTLRAGFSQKYAAPVNADHRTKLTSLTHTAFANFYVPEYSGQEIAVWVGKATLTPEAELSGGSAFALPANVTIGTIFTSHQIVSSAWAEKNWDRSTAGKYWLNHTILTKIEEVVATAGNNYQLNLQFEDATLITDGLNNWSVVNISKTPNEVAHIIDTTTAGGNQVQIHITRKDHTWVAGNTILIMKNYIPYNILAEMYNATATEINFHKVLNDLRIGFGGKANRLGLSIAYRKKYWKISTIEAGSPTITEIAAIDNLILDIYNGSDQEAYIDLEAVTGGTLSAELYRFKLVGVLDDFNKVLLAENQIEIAATYNITINPRIRWGSHNKRLTDLELYGSAGENLPFYRLKQYQLSSNSVTGLVYTIANDGFIYLTASFLDLHTDSNAAQTSTAAPPAEADTVTGWTAYGNDAAIASAALADLPAPYAGTWSLKVNHGYATKTRAGAEYAKVLQQDNDYNFDFYVYTSGAITITVYFVVNIGGVKSYKPIKSYPIPATTWTQINDYFQVGDYGTPQHTEATVVGVAIDALLVATTGYFALDAFHIYQDTTVKIRINQADFDAATNEMVETLGYLPTFDMIRSWDQAIVTQGRTFFVNPYIEKRYENKIFKSHISGAGAFMYDSASAGENIDLENFDGNSLVGIEVLPNLDFIALKTNGSQRVDPNTGATREISFGDGCVSRRSIVNFGNRVVWCGDHDIYASDGLNTISIADKTIREAYRALTTKSSIIATREEKDGAYRFFTGNTTSKQEYILTKKGWITRTTAATIYPVGYSLEQSGQVNFMYAGIIYDDDDSNKDVATNSIIGEVKSADIDAELIGEGLTERDFIFIPSFWVYFTRNISGGDNIVVQAILNLDGTAVTTKNITTASGKQKIFIPVTSGGKNCRRFSIEFKTVSDANSVLGKHISLHSVGVMWKPIPAGHYN